MDLVNKFVEKYAAQIIVAATITCLGTIAGTYAWASNKIVKDMKTREEITNEFLVGVQNVITESGSEWNRTQEN